MDFSIFDNSCLLFLVRYLVVPFRHQCQPPAFLLRQTVLSFPFLNFEEMKWLSTLLLLLVSCHQVPTKVPDIAGNYSLSGDTSAAKRKLIQVRPLEGAAFLIRTGARSTIGRWKNGNLVGSFPATASQPILPFTLGLNPDSSIVFRAGDLTFLLNKSAVL